MSVVGVVAGGACQPDDGVAMDADEAAGLADAVALGQMLQDRDGGRFGEVTAVQRRALALGETDPAGVAVELAELLVLAVAAADREVAGVASARERAVGILAAEARKIVHEAIQPVYGGVEIGGWVGSRLTSLSEKRADCFTPDLGPHFPGEQRSIQLSFSSEGKARIAVPPRVEHPVRGPTPTLVGAESQSAR